MIVDIYGVDEEDFRCGGCITAKRLFDEAGIDFTFHKVLSRDENSFPKYDLAVIDDLVKRAKFPNRQITYPVIFINDEIIRVKNLQLHLYELGYDVDPPI